MEFKTSDDILDFAIGKEQEAADFYTELAEKIEHKHMRQTFMGYAAEERGHKAKLEAVKKGAELVLESKHIVDLKIGDYLIDIEPNPDMSYQEALIVAMKAEKAAFKMYNDLAAKTTSSKLKDLFLVLAQEEAKHKLRFEIEYDEEILREN